MAAYDLLVNGQTYTVEAERQMPLLWVLRDLLGLTGTKFSCGAGLCGSCTVLLNGKRIVSCLTLAVMHDGADLTTIEGIGDGDTLHPLQQAFIEHDAFQCGYCTPGQICSAVAVLAEIRAGVPSHVSADLTERPKVSEAEVRERMSGNICRCGAYSNIVEAIAEVAGRTA